MVGSRSIRQAWSIAASVACAHHLGPVRGATRVERNAERLVTGKVHHLDRHTLEVLAGV